MGVLAIINNFARRFGKFSAQYGGTQLLNLFPRLNHT